MNRDYEALSAFLDGETNELETRRVLRDLDQADIATLGRWQLASDTLRGHASREVPPAFNARLSAALAAESKPAKRAGMMGGFARVAVAANAQRLTLATVHVAMQLIDVLGSNHRLGLGPVLLRRWLFFCRVGKQFRGIRRKRHGSRWWHADRDVGLDGH